MFDKYLIGEQSLRNIGPADAPTGFAFDARLGYYRGLELSMIDDLAIAIDGEAIAPQAVRFHDGDEAIAVPDLGDALGRRWEFGAWATISVDRPGGFPAGQHSLSLTEKLRISYLPFPLLAQDEKQIEATAAG
jgi:hypothetical protein